MMTGYVHSTDSFGTVDGPGIRYVVFMQGCPLRCQYCHNPDTWNTNTGKSMTVDEIFKLYSSVSSFTKGGITVTGGEPLLQIEFVTALFEKFKKHNIHTCLDTSGATFNKSDTEKFDKLLQVCDLILLDLKHIDREEHKVLTGCYNDNILDFARYLSSKNADIWLRHVVIENITLNDEHLINLGKFLAKLKNIKALDIMPYHKMGNDKYKQLNIPYPLEQTPATSKKQASYAMDKIMQGIKIELAASIEANKHSATKLN